MSGLGFNPNSGLVPGMRVKKKSDGMMTSEVYRFVGYADAKGVSPDGSRYGQIYNEQNPLQKEIVKVTDLKKTMFNSPARKGGKRKTKKAKKSIKARKSRKSRKSQKNKKSRKSRKK